MTGAYVVTEGTDDLAILKRVLPEQLVNDVKLYNGGGKYGARSFASSILGVREFPVALVVDADTENESLIREQRNFLNELLSNSSVSNRFEVFQAVPELAAIL